MTSHLRLLAAAATALLAAAEGSDPVALPFEVVAGTRQLFLDQAGVASSQNVAQTMHTPRSKCSGSSASSSATSTEGTAQRRAR